MEEEVEEEGKEQGEEREGSHALLVEPQLLLRAAAASPNADKFPFLERDCHSVTRMYIVW